jgi:hypothetical protein
MCFSATASFIAGASLSAVGVVTIKAADDKTQVPFAAIPLLFGIQQITEGLIWLSLGSKAVGFGNGIATFVYSLFSHVLWPTYVPFVIGLMEAVRWRKNTLVVFQFVGISVSLYLLYFMIRSPITSQVANRSIAYNSSHFYIVPVLIFYFSAACVSCFFSSHRLINLFGVLVLLSALVTYWFFAAVFVSVWCFFAAILSFMIVLHFYGPKKVMPRGPVGERYGSWQSFIR